MAVSVSGPLAPWRGWTAPQGKQHGCRFLWRSRDASTMPYQTIGIDVFLATL